ncbi:MAG: histidine phosphatase family protein [Promicromonosporaceae bacterium]|nr:histidine phosphatase family protein [Promicromonosporaceae bacterium]
MTQTTIHLLRHGEVHNPDRVLYGRLPGFRLSERGRQMAQVVADHLAAQERDLAAIISSPLQRAQETAAPSAAAFGLTVTTDDRLIEADSAFTGTRIGAEPWRLLNPAHWPRLRNPFRPSWGEPFGAQAERVEAAMRAARAAHPGREVLLVSHQLPIWVTRLHLAGRHLWHNPRRRQCSLCSLTSFVYEDDELARIEYAEPAAALSKSLSPGAWSPR